MRECLQSLGVPFTPRARRVVHVAGTKGKGSTCAYLEALCRASGLRTGLYTSPHLVSPRERIRVNGRSIDELTFAGLFDRVQSAHPQAGYFRTLTLMAWAHFDEADLDVLILEVGIGGRFDSTNVVDPDVCVITALALDHQCLLGDTIESIAWHKAGIIKPGKPVYTVPQDLAAMNVVKQEKYSELHVVEGLDDRFDWPASQNIALAKAVFKHCFPDIKYLDDPKFNWPGRQQVVKDESGNDWFLDGAHTLESMEAFVSWLSKATTPNLPLLVFHCSEDRDYRRLLGPLMRISWQSVYLCTPSSSDKPDQRHHEIAQWLAEHNVPARIISSIAAIQSHRDVCVTGSLHLVGDALAHLKVDLDSL